ncbi:MAG: hypothetical protein ACTSX6_04970 [Candidatus Heimdallarchaeaceae archaeon]
MVQHAWELLVVAFLGSFLLIWLISAIYNNVRYQMLQILAFIILLFGYTFSLGEYPVDPICDKIAFFLALFSLLLALVGIAMAKHRWIKRRGTRNLTKFTNLGIYAYIRYPVTYAMIVLCVAVAFFKHSILSNVLCFMAIIFFIVSSFEKDLYYKSIFGYPFQLYASKVPRFFLVFGILKAFREVRKNK